MRGYTTFNPAYPVVQAWPRQAWTRRALEPDTSARYFDGRVKFTVAPCLIPLSSQHFHLLPQIGWNRLGGRPPLTDLPLLACSPRRDCAKRGD